MFLLRLLQLVSAVHSPLAYQFGPDEDYYLRFGHAVADGSIWSNSDFAFMDPLYGFGLGALIRWFGANLFLIYLVQVIVDTCTAWMLFAIGRRLGNARAGLIAAALYGVNVAALMFTTTVLKDTWVSFFLTLWVLLGLRLPGDRRWWAWLGYGVLCGLGIGLRANLTVLVTIGLPLLVWISVRETSDRPWLVVRRAGFMLLGLALPLFLLAWRNATLSGDWSPIPNNGGVVLHQIYNASNPGAETAAPPFVAYMHPIEIWRGYRDEAQRRLGRPLSAHEIDAYWGGEAKAYIAAHPREVAQNMLRKTLSYASWKETPNNRSIVDERMFSAPLRILPLPFGWLFAFGFPGLAWMTVRDRRWWLLIAPVAMSIFTYAVFFAESRFRFHSIGMVTLGAAFFVDALVAWIVAGQLRRAGIALFVSASLGLFAWWAGHVVPDARTDWARIAWGYLRMGDAKDANDIIASGRIEEPAKAEELRGYLALRAGDNAGAVAHYLNAIHLKPGMHVVAFNLATALSRQDALGDAVIWGQRAVALAPLPEYRLLLGQLLERENRNAEAAEQYRALLAGERTQEWAAAAATANQRLQAMTAQAPR